MNGRTIFRIVLGIVVVVALVGLGAGLYNAGIDQGVVQAGRVPAGEAVRYGGYGYGFGWGFPFFGFGFGLLGLIFPILFFVLIFSLFRAAFGGWDRGHRYGGPGPGGYGPGTWQDERRHRLSELHRQLHEDEARGTTGATGSGPTGPGAVGSNPGSNTGANPGGSNPGGMTPPPGA